MTRLPDDGSHAKTPKRHLLLNVAAGLIGFALLGFLVWEIGVDGVFGYVQQIGWLAPFLLLPSVAIALSDAKGWSCALPPTIPTPRIAVWRWSLASLACEAINNLTPTASLGGEPIKVYLLRAYGVSTEAGLASVVVAKTALTVSQIIFILLGMPFFLYRLGWVRQGWWILGILIVLAYGFTVLVIRWQRRGLMGMVVRLLCRVFPRWQRLAQWHVRAREIDAHLLEFYNGSTQGFVAATIYHFVGWMLGAIEVFFFLSAMGVAVTPIDAFIIETMLQPLTVAALVIPGAIGVQEAGGIYLCRLLGIDDAAGLTLMALRRIRETVHNGIGLIVLVRMGGLVLPWKAHSV